MSKRILSLLLAVLHALLPGVAVWAEPVELSEEAVKAAFVFNFAKFTEWPAQVFDSPETPFTLCVLGAESFNALRDSTTSKLIQGRAVLVRGDANAESGGVCQILFISARQHLSNDTLAGLLSAQHVLTVSDRENFAASGGIIGLYREDGKIKFEINRMAAERAGLKLSSHLLRLARTVDTTSTP